MLFCNRPNQKSEMEDLLSGDRVVITLDGKFLPYKTY